MRHCAIKQSMKEALHPGNNHPPGSCVVVSLCHGHVMSTVSTALPFTAPHAFGLALNPSSSFKSLWGLSQVHTLAESAS